MKKNMGSADRIFRVVVGVILAVLFFTGVVDGTPGIFVLILSMVFFLTGFIGYCGLYSLLGMNSLKKEKTLTTKPSVGTSRDEDISTVNPHGVVEPPPATAREEKKASTVPPVKDIPPVPPRESASGEKKSPPKDRSSQVPPSESTPGEKKIVTPPPTKGNVPPRVEPDDSPDSLKGKTKPPSK